MRMGHKCDGCFWKTDWNNGVEQYPICEQMWYSTFEIARGRCEIPGTCEDYLSDDLANKIVDRFNEIPN